MSRASCIVLGVPFLCAAVWILFALWQAVDFMGSNRRADDRGLHSGDIVSPAEAMLGATRSTANDAAKCPTCVAGDRAVDNYMPTHPLEVSDYEADGGYLLFHTWFEGKKLFTGFEYMLTGYLVSQNLAKTKMIVWMTDDWLTSSDDPTKPYIVQKYRAHPNIEFRYFEKENLVKGTCWEHRPEFMEKKTVQTYGMRDYSNVVRWLLLYNYGGIWLDADSIPLTDMSILHELNQDSILVGYAMPGKKELEASDRPKELGMFNNNFIHLTDRAMKDKIMEVACEFRRKPLEDGEKGYANEPFVNVIPKIGPDQHELYVMNTWLFNDGTLRYCWIRDDCKLNRIDLGSTDPVWVRSNDMYAICERIIQTMERYTAAFTELVKARQAGAEGLRKYLMDSPMDRHVFVIHDRLSHCRTSKTVPIGMSKWFGDLMDMQIKDGNPLNAPVEPQNVLVFDPYEKLKPNHEISFVPLVIAMESPADKFEERQVMRGLINNRNWFPNLFESGSRRPMLLFIVPYHPKYNDWNAKLHTELYMHNDLILVDPSDNKMARSPTNMVSPVMRRGLLKMLNGFDCRFMMLLFGPDAFVHVRNLYYFLNVASGLALFNKEKSIRSFVVTHRMSDGKEMKVQEALQKDKIGGVDKPPSTIFRAFTQYTKKKGRETSNQQSFVIFTRDNLKTIIGAHGVTQVPTEPTDFADNISEIDEGDYGGQPDFVWEFTKRPRTLTHAVTRLPPFAKEKGRKIWMGEPVAGLEAETLEDFGFFGSPYGGPALEKFREKASFAKSDTRCAENTIATDLEPKLPPPPDAWTEDMREAIVHMNVTAVWDVPCVPAHYELQSAIETIPVLFVK